MLTRLAALAVVPLVFALALQDPAPAPQGEEQEQEPLVPLSDFRRSERQRMEREMQGTWVLTLYRGAYDVVEQSTVRGFLMFDRGLVAMNLQLIAQPHGFIGRGERYYVQAGLHRYRLTELLQLQLASVMAFTNANDQDELAADPASYPREYDNTIAGNDLTLRRWDGEELTFRRMRGGEFPDDAIRRLDRARGSGEAVQDEER
jgi:hypothetical protein